MLPSKADTAQLTIVFEALVAAYAVFLPGGRRWRSASRKRTDAISVLFDGVNVHAWLAQAVFTGRRLALRVRANFSLAARSHQPLLCDCCRQQARLARACQDDARLKES